MEQVAFQFRWLSQSLFQNSIEYRVKLSLKEYLLSLGDEVLRDPKRLEVEKVKYKKMYMKAYKQAYNQTHKRVKLTFRNEEYEKVLRQAQKAKKPLAAYIKECFYSYINSEYLTADDNQVSELGGLLRQIGNNINQVARWANQNRYIQPDNIHYIYNQLKFIQDKINEIFKRPDNLLDVVKDAMEENPFFKEELIQLLNSNNTEGSK